MSLRPLCQYIVLHRSCGNKAGIAASQAVHAATECLTYENVPVAKDTTVCILECNTAEELEHLHETLTAEGIKHCIIREPDAPYNGAPTAVGIAPMERELIRHLFAQFKPCR